jgi:hypothetical protein
MTSIKDGGPSGFLMADPGAADAAEGATAANKDLWTRINAEYTDEQALRS